jgi:hypothetical protein
VSLAALLILLAVVTVLVNSVEQTRRGQKQSLHRHGHLPNCHDQFKKTGLVRGNITASIAGCISVGSAALPAGPGSMLDDGEDGDGTVIKSLY